VVVFRKAAECGIDENTTLHVVKIKEETIKFIKDDESKRSYGKRKSHSTPISIFIINGKGDKEISCKRTSRVSTLLPRFIIHKSEERIQFRH